MLNEVTKVNIKGKEILLLGTAHVSKDSVELVEKTIEKESPDFVAVELCDKRQKSLANEKKWSDTEINKVVREGNAYLFLMQLLLANFQRKIGEDLGIRPGAEMIKALEIAEKKGMGVALVDRDINVTLKRAFSKMSLKEKSRIFIDIISGAFDDEEINEELLEKLKEKDIITEIMEDLGREIPSAKEVLVDERDRYIANRILNLDAKKVLAVVGAGHVDGIKGILESNSKSKKDLNNEIDELDGIPQKKSRIKLIAYIIPAIFIAIVGYGFYSHGFSMTLDILLKWFLINGTLSAIGVLLAMGHPLSALTAFLAAPFTSLNPTIAAGWFAGITETWIRKPRVKDIEGLLKLNSISDYWKNRVTRILLVIAFANIGSSIGTFIALPYLAAML